MQLWETGTHVSPQLQASENCLMHTQAERLDTGVQGMTVPLCYSVCSRLMKGGQPCCQVRTLHGWCPMTADLKASGGLHFYLCFFFLLLADCSLGGWMSEKIQGRSGKSRQFHFPSATLVQHQQAFHSLTYFGLYTTSPPPKQRLCRVWDPAGGV